MRFAKILSWFGIAAATAVAGCAVNTNAPRLDSTPDAPASFGYKVNWFAIKSADPADVARALGLTGLQRANWETGIAAAYSPADSTGGNAFAYLSAPVNGWVFLISSSLVYPDQRPSTTQIQGSIGQRFDQTFAALAGKFSEVQFFGSYRVVGFDAWARARNGRIERVFSLADGEVLANVGSQTVEERTLKFFNSSGLSLDAAIQAIAADAAKREAQEERLVSTGMKHQMARQQLLQEQRDAFPSEDDTMDIAGAWSINPSRLEEQKLPPSVGYVVALPKSMCQ